MLSAYFGSGVASYFVFLRRIIWLNVAIALVAFGFICVPQVALFYSIFALFLIVIF